MTKKKGGKSAEVVRSRTAQKDKKKGKTLVLG